MPAYIIVDVNIQDANTYETYKKLTPASLLPYQGKFIVRGGETTLLEGDWKTGRIVVLEFPSTTLAKQWWDSAEYAPAKALRQQSAHTKMIMVEGFEG